MMIIKVQYKNMTGLVKTIAESVKLAAKNGRFNETAAGVSVDTITKVVSQKLEIKVSIVRL